MAMEAVTYYERGIAAVLRKKPVASKHSEGVVFHAYRISYQLVAVGSDSSQSDADDFGILVAEPVDEEVAEKLEVNIFLPCGGLAKAGLRSEGIVILGLGQVELLRNFNKWLFDLLLGRSTVFAADSHKDGPKTYFIFPLANRSNVKEITRHLLINWNLLNCLIRYDLHLANKLPTHSAKTAVVDANPLPMEGNLKMGNGEVEKEELVDSLVTCTRNGLLYYGASIVRQVNWEREDAIIYSDLNKELSGLGNEQRLMIKARRHFRANSYLRPIQNDEKSTKDLETYTLLSPEKCVLHKGLRGSFYRGALRLPSVLYKLETALLSAELRDLIGIQISTFKVLEALTSGACALNESYETLELLGDSVLKLTASTCVYFEEPSLDCDGLGMRVYEIVCNKSLFMNAKLRNLQQYIFADMFAPIKWIPPGPVPETNSKCICSKKQRRFGQTLQLISYRTIADVVEALLGTYVLHCNMNTTLNLITWLQIPIHFPSTAKFTCPIEIYSLLEKCDFEELQHKLGYFFHTPELLAGALSYTVTPLIFQRLEFLGEAVLDFLVTQHLVVTYASLPPGKLNELRQAIINRENYSCVAFRKGLHVYLQKACPTLEHEISNFARNLMEEHSKGKSFTPYGISRESSPKVIGDMVKTLAASIYLDSDYNLETVWNVYRQLLEPIVTPDSSILHPIEQLKDICRREGWSFELLLVSYDGGVEVKAKVNDEVLGIYQHAEKKIARRLATMKALEHIANRRPPMKDILHSDVHLS